MDAMEEHKVLDDKEAESLCKVVRKLGGPSDKVGNIIVSLKAESISNLRSFVLCTLRGVQDWQK